MNKKTTTLNISLLPIVVIVLLILGAGYFLVKDDIDLSKIFNREPKVRRLEGFPVVINTNQILDKQRTLVKSQAELDTFLKAIDPSATMINNDNIIPNFFMADVFNFNLKRGLF